MSNQKHIKPLRVSAVDLLPAMRDLSREPFQEVMALCLAAAPTPANLVAFAQDYPDRWANMCAIFAKLSGFSDKVDHDHRHLHLHQVHQMSDAQLLQALEDMKQIEPAGDVTKLDKVTAEIRAERLTYINETNGGYSPTTKSISKKRNKQTKLVKPRIIRLKRRTN